jgi:hypothetical protein
MERRLASRLSVVWGRLREQRGTALAELAIVMPVLLILLLGMLDFGKAFNSWIDETHLANEGARLAAVNYLVPGCPAPPSAPGTCMQQYIQGLADTKELKSGRTGSSSAPAQTGAKVCISFPDVGHANPLVGDPVQVTVSIDYKWLNYLTSRLSILSTPITGKATMRLEGVPTTYTAGCYTPGAP